jgi:hypothetical protein
MTTVAEYRVAQHNRREAVSLNASLRMRGLPPVELPALPPMPMNWEVSDADGCYVGVWAASGPTESKSDALAEAAEAVRHEAKTGGIVYRLPLVAKLIPAVR